VERVLDGVEFEHTDKYPTEILWIKLLDTSKQSVFKSTKFSQTKPKDFNLQSFLFSLCFDLLYYSFSCLVFFIRSTTIFIVAFVFQSLPPTQLKKGREVSALLNNIVKIAQKKDVGKKEYASKTVPSNDFQQ
jgi:hypothetical protein